MEHRITILESKTENLETLVWENAKTIEIKHREISDSLNSLKLQTAVFEERISVLQLNSKLQTEEIKKLIMSEIKNLEGRIPWGLKQILTLMAAIVSINGLLFLILKVLNFKLSF